MNKLTIVLIIIGLAVAVPVIAQKTEIFDIVYDSTMGMFNAEQPLSVGNSTGNITINTSGFTYAGNARSVKVIQEWAYDLTGNTGTFNGISCITSGLSSLDRMTYFRSFDDGQGAGQCETAIWNGRLPDDYEDGTNVTLELPWVSSATTGNVVWQCGMRVASNGDMMNGTENYATAQTIAVPSSAWERADMVFEFDGSSFLKNDIFSTVCLRDADNGADTSSGDSHIHSMNLKYVSVSEGLPIADSNLAGN